MGTIKWKKQDPAPDPQDDLRLGPDAETTPAIMELALELAKEMDGSLLAIYTAAPDTTSVLVRVASGLLEVRVPHGVTKLEDCPEEATHYCTGLSVAKALKEDGVEFSSAAGHKALMDALSGYDRLVSMDLAKGWITYHLGAAKAGLTPPPAAT